MKNFNFLLSIRIFVFFLFCSFSIDAQQSRKNKRITRTKPKTTAAANSQSKSISNDKQNAGLTLNSFSAKGLNNEKLLTDFYLGDFVEIPFDRDNLNFGGLYGAYLTSYARRCAAHLPRNKIEMTYQKCRTERVTTNGYGMEISRTCVEWQTVGTGLYADPQMYDAKLKIDRLQAGDAIRNVFGIFVNPDPIGGVMKMVGNAQSVASDMNSLLAMNSCTSPGLRRFQENLRLFALNKQPIRLASKSNTSLSTPSSKSVPFKDQNYTELLEDLVFEQSKSWMMNKYMSGSISAISVSSRDNQGRPSKLEAEYLYNGFNSESRGSVTLIFADGLPECLYFFDFPTTCRTPNRKIVAAYANGAYQK